jgi:hypothetical protein
MVKNIRPLVDKASNVDWLNAVRNSLGSEYQSRIPEATQANVAETIDQLWNYQAGRNHVFDAFVNRIGLVLFKNTLWSNVLAPFKIGTFENGDTIEEVMNGLLTAVDYDFDRDELEKEIFGTHPFETQTSFHKINRRDRYTFTVNQPGLRMALLNNELGSFLANVMSMPQTSDQNDEFLLMMNLFKEFDKAEAYHIQNVPDVGDPDSGPDESKVLLRRIREFNNTLPFISRLYNPAGMPVAANPDKLILLTTATADAAMDVEALAAAFNIGKAEVANRKIVIPERYFGIDGLQAILTTSDFFVVADNLIETTSQFNPAKLTTNFWLHHWQIMSASRFAPLVMFSSTRPSTVISETPTPVTSIGAFTLTDKAGNVAATNVLRGVLYDVAVVGVTTPAGTKSPALDLDLSGHTSQFSYINNGGELYLGPDETAESVTITATSVDNGFNTSTSRGVAGAQIIPWPNPVVQTDIDADALEEVTPKVPTFTANVITIPKVAGVTYKDGATNLTDGQKITVVVGTPKTITATAKTGKELAAGAPASWVFTAV